MPKYVRKRQEKVDFLEESLPKRKKSLINVEPFQAVKPVDFNAEPQIDSLVDLFEAEDEDDVADSPYVNMSDVHRENIQNMLDEAKKEDPKIISLMNHGYKFETLAVMTDDELQVLVDEKVRELKNN